MEVFAVKTLHVQIKVCSISYYASSYFYSFGRKSLKTELTLFDYDEKKNSMNCNAMLTGVDGIKSIIRLYESLDLQKDKTVTVGKNEVSTYNKTIITNQLLVQGNQMPKVTMDELPYWNGFTMGFASPLDLVNGYRFQEEDFRNIVNWGFNFVRIYVDYSDIFNLDLTEVKLGRWNN